MDFEDSSVGHTEVHTPTITGATIDTATHKYGGGSGKFDGNDQVTYPKHLDFAMRTTPFTIGCWVYKADGVDFTQIISQFQDNQHYWYLWITKATIQHFVWHANTILSIYKSGLSMGTGWHHIEVGRDADSGYIFLDGVKQTLNTGGNIYSGDAAYFDTPLVVGYVPFTYSSGNIDVLKIDKGICRHTADFTPPANEDVDNDSYTVLLLKMNPTIAFNIDIGDAWKEGVPYINIGDAWQEKRPAGDADKKWRAIACDDDCSFIVVGEDGGRLYTSTNNGETWTERQPAGNVDRKWTGVACDSDGSNLIVCCYNTGTGTGRVYTSSDNGVNWTERQPAGNTDKYWICVCSDSDGSVLLACEDGGRLWMSVDSGTSWTEPRPAGNNNKTWKSVACDSDGSVIFCCYSTNGRAWVSIDTGANWTETRPLGNVDEYWGQVAVIGDGSVLLICPIYTHSGRVHKSSNTGTDWTVINPFGDFNWIWNNIAISSDGNVIIVIGWFTVDGIFVSKDGGTSWLNDNVGGNTNWRGCDVSNDGKRCVICSLSISPSPITGRVYVEYLKSWKTALKVYQAQGGNSTWESVKDNTWEDLASENWDYEKQSWRRVI